MTAFIFRADSGADWEYEAETVAAAIEHARGLLLDDGAEDGEGGGLYQVEDTGRGIAEDYVDDVRIGDDERAAPWADIPRLVSGDDDE
jgi:hypothetical protein